MNQDSHYYVEEVANKAFDVTIKFLLEHLQK